MNIPFKEHVTNEVICRQSAIGEYEKNPGPARETETVVVCPHLKVFWLSKDNSAGQSERKANRKKKRWENNT